MRITLNIDEHSPSGKPRDRKIRLRMGYYFDNGDKIQVQNCGVEIYNLIKEGFEHSLSGGIIEFLGERK